MSNSKLIQELDNRNMNIRQLALAADIVPQSLYAAVHGRVYFWPGWKKRVAEALDMSVDELFEEQEVNNAEA